MWKLGEYLGDHGKCFVCFVRVLKLCSVAQLATLRIYEVC